MRNGSGRRMVVGDPTATLLADAAVVMTGGRAGALLRSCGHPRDRFPGANSSAGGGNDVTVRAANAAETDVPLSRTAERSMWPPQLADLDRRDKPVQGARGYRAQVNSRVLAGTSATGELLFTAEATDVNASAPLNGCRFLRGLLGKG
jgi:hypothetical protein